MSQQNPSGPHRLTYDRPGHGWGWADHVVLGNGRLGATLGGGVHREVIRLNEETIWSRGATDPVNPDAARVLPEVRRLLGEGRVTEAEELADAGMMGVPRHVEPYQPIGRLILRLGRGGPPAGVDRYERWLDLSTGVAGVQYGLDGAEHRREAFVSQPDQVMALRLTTSGADGLDLVVELTRELDDRAEAVDGRTIRINGRASGEGTRYAAMVSMLSHSGTSERMGNRIVVRGADSVTLLIACETDYWETFRGRAVEKPYVERVGARLNAAEALGYDALRERHVEDHAALYGRASLSLGLRTDDVATTGEWLEAAASGVAPPALFALQFNFARYLLIACSREGGLPANLQGLWSDSMTPVWNSDYHTNINLQMNYWLAEVCNLAELHRPLLDWLAFMSTSGERTAEVHYGCGGWVMHHLADPWGFTAPADDVQCGLWPMGGAWCALHAWEHYRFTRDLAYLRGHGYPLMRGAAAFLLDYLQPTEAGELISGPSVSPENRYRLPDGGTGHLCMGPTMDHQIIRELFNATVDASRLLDRDDTFAAALLGALDHVPQTRVSPDGTLAEWHGDAEEVDPGHRHLSHLFALFPGTQVSDRRTPQLADAARRTIQRRLAHQNDDAEAGWSYAWKACFYARLGEPAAALHALNRLARHCTQPNLIGVAHRVPQVDCTLGVAAAVAEMLLQSHDGVVTLLPALPREWADGSFTGLVARGGVVVDARWQAHRLTHAQLTSANGCDFTLATGTGQVPVGVGSRTAQTDKFKLSIPARGTLRLDRWADAREHGPGG